MHSYALQLNNLHSRESIPRKGKSGTGEDFPRYRAIIIPRMRIILFLENSIRVSNVHTLRNLMKIRLTESAAPSKGGIFLFHQGGDGQAFKTVFHFLLINLKLLLRGILLQKGKKEIK